MAEAMALDQSQSRRPSSRSELGVLEKTANSQYLGGVGQRFVLMVRRTYQTGKTTFSEDY